MTHRFASVVGLMALSLLACPRKEESAEDQAANSGPPNGFALITEQQMKDAKITVAPIADQAISDTVVTSGHVSFDDARVAHVFSPVSGRVTNITGEIGKRVKKGDPLATIESPDIGIASSDVGKAQADLVAAEHDYKRKKELFDEHAASQADVETSEDNYRKAKAELDRAVKKNILLGSGSGSSVSQGYTLRAAIDGEIIQRTVSPNLEIQGQYGGGTATELFTIGELDRVWILADVYEIDLARVKVGQKVTIKVVAYGDHVFEGKVDLVSSTLDPVTRTTRVRCTFDNSDKEHQLRPEMYATVTIYVDETKALAIPHDAILRLGDQTVVFVDRGKTDDGKLKFERVPVSVDEGEGDTMVPLLHGPPKGTPIVTSGAILLSGML